MQNPCGIQVSASNDSIELVVDLNVYNLDAVKRAGYKFSDRCGVLLTQIEDGKLHVQLNSIKKISKDNLLMMFCNELLDQDLRISIAKETEPVRNLILAYAFSKTSLSD